MYNATIVKRLDITDRLMIVGVKPDQGVPDFTPGQYLALGLLGSAPRAPGFKPDKEEVKPDKIIKRAYSIGSSPDNKEYIELYVALVDDGALTPRLAPLKVGDRLFAAPKIVGTFTLDPVPSECSAVLVSTGTGVAPFLSMVRTPACWTPNRRLTIVHGVRYVKDLAYRDELLALAERNKNFSYYSIVSRPDAGWTGETGYVQSFFEREVIKIEPDRDHVFVCGNPSMIEDMEKLLLGRGYREHSKKEPGSLHIEKYW